MTILLAQKLDRVKPSATLAVSAKASALKAQGEDILDFSAGEPDFDTPDFIKRAGIQAIENGLTKYTIVDGTTSLKQAIVQKFAKENSLHYEPNQITVSTGAKQVLFNAFTALLNPGDEAIIPAPYWTSYPDMILLADGAPVIIRADAQSRFKITPIQLESAITSKTRILILNSPSNPSGVVYTKEELVALGKVLKNHPRITIVTDDIYEHILWTDTPFVNILNACPGLYDRTLVVNGVSKAYAMTGWRIGYAGGPLPLINAMRKIQSQSTSNPNSIAQAAAQAALIGDQSFIQQMKSEFKRRHDFLFEAINQIPGLNCQPTDGAFYMFISAETAIKEMNIKTDVAFCESLLNEAKVALVPGSAFGMPGYVRMSYASDMKLLEEGILRIKTALTSMLAVN
ncbi:MAG: aatA [Gammaproteobacteria bacterium]|jgi:aspartate aminotransferase|nr:aatA [Gammaproteobacteria bacterium]